MCFLSEQLAALFSGQDSQTEHLSLSLYEGTLLSNIFWLKTAAVHSDTDLSKIWLTVYKCFFPEKLMSVPSQLLPVQHRNTVTQGLCRYWVGCCWRQSQNLLVGKGSLSSQREGSSWTAHGSRDFTPTCAPYTQLS